MKCYICKKESLLYVNDLYKCSKCGFVQVDYDTFEMIPNDVMLKKTSKTILHRTLMLRDFIVNKDVLDFGSGVARYQQAANNLELSYKSWTNVDNNLDVIEYSKSIGYVVKLYVDTSTMFDFIICSHVIEHLLNPLDFLLQLKSLLREDGHLYIEVPAIESSKDENWYEAQHVSYFTKENLKKLLTKHFTIVDWNTSSATKTMDAHCVILKGKKIATRNKKLSTM